MQLSGFPFRIFAEVRHCVNGAYVRVPEGENIPLTRKYLGFFLACNQDENGRCSGCDIEWECHVSAVLRVFQHGKNGDTAGEAKVWKSYVKRLSHKQHEWGWWNFITCEVWDIIGRGRQR